MLTTHAYYTRTPSAYDNKRFLCTLQRRDFSSTFPPPSHIIILVSCYLLLYVRGKSSRIRFFRTNAGGIKSVEASISPHVHVYIHKCMRETGQPGLPTACLLLTSFLLQFLPCSTAAVVTINSSCCTAVIAVPRGGLCCVSWVHVIYYYRST